MTISAIELIEKEFGVRTRVGENPETGSLGTSGSRILGNNPNRLAWVIVNLSPNDIYVTPRGEPSTTNGIKIAASGGFRSTIYREDFTLVTWEWRGIATGAGSNIHVLEVVSY